MRIGIRLKLFLGYLTLILLFIVTILIVLSSINSLDENVQKTHDHPLAVTRASKVIEVLVTSMHRSMKDVSFSADKEERDGAI